MGADTPPLKVSVEAAPGLLGDVVRRAISEAPDLRLVALPHRRPAEPMYPDVLILAGIDPDSITWPASDQGSASMRLLAISEQGHTGWLFELLPRRRMLGELTPEALVAAVRAPLPSVVTTREGHATNEEPNQECRHETPSPEPRRPTAAEED